MRICGLENKHGIYSIIVVVLLTTQEFELEDKTKMKMLLPPSVVEQ